MKAQVSVNVISPNVEGRNSNMYMSYIDFDRNTTRDCGVWLDRHNTRRKSTKALKVRNTIENPFPDCSRQSMDKKYVRYVYATHLYYIRASTTLALPHIHSRSRLYLTLLFCQVFYFLFFVL